MPGVTSAFPAPMSTPQTPAARSVASDSPPQTPSAGPSAGPSVTSSMLPSPAMLSTPHPSPALLPSSSASQKLLPAALSTAFLPPARLQPAASEACGPLLNLEGRTLLERAGVYEESFSMTKAPMPTCDLPAALQDLPGGLRSQSSSQSLPTGAGLADQLSTLLDDQFCKRETRTPSPPPSEPAVMRQESNQLRQSIASQLSAVLLDDDISSGWEENDSFNATDFANHLAAMRMSPPRCHTAQRSKASNGWLNPATHFGTAIQRPHG